MSEPDGSASRPESAAPKSRSRDRRGFLSLSSLAMAGGLVGGYGVFAGLAGRFLYPARSEGRAWVFVTDLARLRVGDAIVFRTPAGAPVNIARRTRNGDVSDFLALSSTCPHLGCQVHWEGHNDRFFCPCHNGVFTPEGEAIGGPPGEAGTDLPRYPLKVEGNLLYIEVPTATLAAGDPASGGPAAGAEDRPRTERPAAESDLMHARGASRAGHDPCLFRRPGEHA